MSVMKNGHQLRQLLLNNRAMAIVFNKNNSNNNIPTIINIDLYENTALSSKNLQCAS